MVWHQRERHGLLTARIALAAGDRAGAAGAAPVRHGGIEVGIVAVQLGDRASGADRGEQPVDDAGFARRAGFGGRGGGELCASHGDERGARGLQPACHRVAVILQAGAGTVVTVIPIRGDHYDHPEHRRSPGSSRCCHDLDRRTGAAGGAPSVAALTAGATAREPVQPIDARSGSHSERVRIDGRPHFLKVGPGRRWPGRRVGHPDARRR
ncbi:MAG: hypothetical protein M3Y48_18935 [Actinomycetota bacterium]|nr:hypothetical protein [Actinomycetota bacterium]